MYWDLVRIYDTSPRYGDRNTAKSGNQIGGISAIQPYLSRHRKKGREQFTKIRQEPNHYAAVFANHSIAPWPLLYRGCRLRGPPEAVELTQLRKFRDIYLRPYRPGQAGHFGSIMKIVTARRALDRRGPGKITFGTSDAHPALLAFSQQNNF